MNIEQMNIEQMNTERIALPEAFADRMRALLKDEYEAFVQSLGDERVQGLRFNVLKGSQQAFEQRFTGRFGLRPVPWCREGYYYQAGTRPGRHPCHEAGVYYIQEPSAMAVVSLLDPRPEDRVLDLCAAPGGKTTHIAGRLRGEGLLVSNEIHPSRAKILSQNVERMGIRNAIVTNEEPSRLSPRFLEFFDKIVVDAPCSGEGMFRKDEGARQEWSPDHVTMCARRQAEILDEAAAMLKPGGRLVYSTCTFAPEEDEGSVAAFLERHPEFAICKAGQGHSDVVIGEAEQGHPEFAIGEAERLLPGLSAGRPEWTADKRPELADTFRIWPHKVQGEGHYLALLEKRMDRTETVDGNSMRTESVREGFCQTKSIEKADRTDSRQKTSSRKGNSSRQKNSGRQGNTSTPTPDQGTRKLLEEFVITCIKKNPGWYQQNLILFGEQLYRLPEGAPELAGLKVLRPGLHLGTVRKNRLEPAHALAMALHQDEVAFAADFPADSQEIRSYLAGGTLPCAKAQKGWTLICADGYSIGWAKAAGGILKNHYPKGLRLP